MNVRSIKKGQMSDNREARRPETALTICHKPNRPVHSADGIKDYFALQRYIRLIAVILMLSASFAYAETTQTSWYSNVETHNRRCADGRWHDLSKEFIAASWDFPLGTVLLVTNVANGKKVKVVVSDRGPAKRLCKLGRKLDLSKAAFCAVASLKQGLVLVEVKQIKKGGE